MKVLATYSIKGGVGKTTAAVNLAHEAGQAGARVLVWDLDPQGSATYLLRVRPRMKGGARRLVRSGGELDPHIRGTDHQAVHCIPADFSLRHLDLHLDSAKRGRRRLAELLEPLGARYDVAILDCPPSISLASEGVFRATDALLVPVVPATLASRTLEQLAEVLADLEDAPRLLPFLSMVDRRRVLHRELVENLGRDWPQLLPQAIPAAAAVERMGSERRPVAVTDPRSPATRAFRTLWSQLAEELWG